ncbi:polysaccharide biosynthesis protein, partial [Candidatus Roizmanbacteria bacterium]|nr:polysaccharide biosynthesis protein [Candidatus Roizmanbacteria bacterium]
MRTKSSVRNRYVLLGDLLLIAIIVIGSFAIRLELGSAFSFYMPSALWMVCIALIIKPLVYYEFGLYRRLWIYASVQEMKLIVAAVT